MNRYALLAISSLLLLTTGCGQSKKQKGDVISQRYIHKYGYDVSRDDWQSQNYPGQVVTTLRNGITITSTYEEGILHGSHTETYPHSLTLRVKEIYQHGHLAKKTTYDIRGVPTNEEEYLSPSSVKISSWYKKGTPRSVEEHHENALVDGAYYTLSNELESRVENGYGTRTSRNPAGELLYKDRLEEGKMISRETYYQNGNPNTYISYQNGKMHGSKKIFGPSGEPVSIEPYEEGVLNGIVTNFQNGYRYHEVPFVNGIKEGQERYYVDGENVIEEIEWHGNLRHGQTVVYLDGYSRSEWYYNGDRVSKSKFNELVARDEMISTMHERSRREGIR